MLVVNAFCSREVVLMRLLGNAVLPPPESSTPEGPSKRRSVSRGIKQLFQSATKFVRLLQR